MTEGRRGLGRGLSALLEETRVGEAGDQSRGVQELPIELVRANPAQPRRRFEPLALEELADSIRRRGVLQPILVRPAPQAVGEFQIVAGERRWRAAQLARLHAIPAIVRPIADDDLAILALIENLQRSDLNAIEEARAYAELLERLDGDVGQVADAVGKSRPHIANTLRLLRLPPAVRERVEEGSLTAGHARAIANANDPSAAADEVVRRGLSVRQSEALAREKRGVASRRRPGAKDPDTLALERDVAEAIGLDVEIADHGGSGEVRIRYRGLEQLDEVCRRLSRR